MPLRPTVLVYEYFTGGGCPAGDLPGGLAFEALGMLWALLTDFQKWGGVHTIAALDPRFEERIPGLNRNTLPADEVVSVSHDNHQKLYLSLLKRCNAAIIIAPETDDILAQFTAQAEMAGVTVLGSSATATATAGNKAICHQLFQKAKLPNPETLAVDFATAFRSAEKMGFPLVMKPIDGIGSEGVFRVNRLSDLPEALEMIRCLTNRNQILLQSFAVGIHASVSLLVAGDRCLPLSINRQLIEVSSSFRYLGSEIPFGHKAGQYAIELACSAARLIPGLSGYVGVDLVLHDESAQLIEINPRLTTSYIGLRQIAKINMAQVIWEAGVSGSIPEQAPLAGRVIVKKEDPLSWGLSVSRIAGE
jgi:tyramine---L-glutamate ligase